MPAGTANWLTWANLLTCLRLGLVPATVLAILFNDWGLAFSLFWIAVVSDLADGILARALDQQSSLGGLLDHSTDAFYVATTCWALAQLDILTPFLAPLILLSFAQYMLDSNALAGQPLRASKLGRYNGICYFVLAGVAVGSAFLEPYIGVVAYIALLVPYLAWLLVLSTLISMADRAYTLYLTKRR
ncbi:MAG: CDP-alcohol phosphatidyltransferase family protein [Pseudomonadota bacterium]